MHAALNAQAGLRAGFLRNAELLPDHPALAVGKRVHTYAEANETARRWAARLIEGTGGRPRRVAVFAHRTDTAYLAVLASLFAGAAFVPLNRTFPLERTRALLRQADVDAVVADEESLPQLADALRGLPRAPAVLLPKTDLGPARGSLPGPVFARDELAATAPLTDLPALACDDLAYLLFTSGSTGVPKGVPISHANARAFFDVNLARYRLGRDDRLAQTFDLTFDLSIFNLFMAWESGACVCAMEPLELLAPFAFLEKNQITMWFSVPSVAAMLIKRGVLAANSMPTLRWSLFCGESLPRATAEAWQAAAPRSVVENLYGPTELTIACAAYRWDPLTSPGECVQDVVPIGEVYPGLAHLVVDAAGCDVAPGAAGELCVAGAQTALGYWRAPELTAARFFARAAPGGGVTTYYRTGDLVVRHGTRYVYLGRTDHQVKVGGYRIELGEIEAVLRRAGCSEATALPWPDEQRPESIVAVVSREADPALLSAVAGRHLPSYMVPRAIVPVDALPLNQNGKVDRAALRRWLHGRLS